MPDETGERAIRSCSVTVAILAAVACLATVDAAHAENALDGVLQLLNLKAKPAEPAPDFVVRTRPDASRLTFMAPAIPHKVGPLKPKTPAEVAAAAAALDAAKATQLLPRPPIDLARKKAAKAPAVETGADDPIAADDPPVATE